MVEDKTQDPMNASDSLKRQQKEKQVKSKFAMQYLQKRNINRQSSRANRRDADGAVDDDSDRCIDIDNSEEAPQVSNQNSHANLLHNNRSSNRNSKKVLLDNGTYMIFNNEEDYSYFK